MKSYSAFGIVLVCALLLTFYSDEATGYGMQQFAPPPPTQMGAWGGASSFPQYGDVVPQNPGFTVIENPNEGIITKVFNGIVKFILKLIPAPLRGLLGLPDPASIY